ncbi:MAG: hypothetical protein ACREQV_10880 [Candidatus Binatia bacterium]
MNASGEGSLGGGGLYRPLEGDRATAVFNMAPSERAEVALIRRSWNETEPPTDSRGLFSETATVFE